MSLYELQRERLINTLKEANATSKHVITDDLTDSIVTSLIPKNEILIHCYTYNKIDSIERSTGQGSALYFLSANDYSIDCLLTDFKYCKRYEYAIIAFMSNSIKYTSNTNGDNGKNNSYQNPNEFADESGLSPSQLKKLSTCKNLLEVASNGRFEMIDFLNLRTIDQRIFVSDSHYSIPCYFNYENLGYDLYNYQVVKAVNSMLTLCILTNEYPIIRYYNSKISKELAFKLQNAIDQYYAQNTNIEPNFNKTIFFITDRTMDLISPFYYYQTYKSLTFDFIPDLMTKHRGDYDYIYKYEVETGTGTETKTLILNSTDDKFWNELKNKMFSDAVTIIKRYYHELLEENKGYEQVTDLRHAALTTDDFALKKQLIVGHFKLINKLTQMIGNSPKISDMMVFESKICSNIISSKELYEPVTDDLIDILNPNNKQQQQDVDISDKMRMLILYAIYRGGIIESDIRKLCFFGIEDKSKADSIIEFFKNFQKFGFNLIKPDPRSKSVNPGKKISPYHSISNTDVYTERYTSGLINIIGKIAFNRLPEYYSNANMKQDRDHGNGGGGGGHDSDPHIEFPYTKISPFDDATDTSILQSYPGNGNAAPRRRPKWTAKPSDNYDINRPKMFVFVAGGLTQSEITEFSRLEEKVNKNIFVGTDEIYSTNDLIGDIRLMDSPRDDLELPLDKFLEHRDVPQHVIDNAQKVKARQDQAASRKKQHEQLLASGSNASLPLSSQQSYSQNSSRMNSPPQSSDSHKHKSSSSKKTDKEESKTKSKKKFFSKIKKIL
ncbi:unnamed protein product [[Candida] boidinii]|uniref:Unnamed protein product n=1 Tax=Candida boidinii TaxID=5477 RepID=A0A9W6T159_CANBO|nr:hypothetical protein B5S30_g2691 [[Candida] boidinii]GME71230.1 unnamed protein product [[Candida] boidinii]GMF97764.1 unnamed protein product [[Candida] boidinii]